MYNCYNWSISNNCVFLNSFTMEKVKVRIAMTGSSGAGKTSVLNALIDKYNNGDLAFPLPHVLFSQTQDVYNRYKIYTEEQALYTSQHILKAVQFELFDERVVLEQQCESFISDRSIIDYYLYTLIRCMDVLTYDEVERLKVRMLECVRQYDLVLNFESSPFKVAPVDDDGFRLRSYGTGYIYQQLHVNIHNWHVGEAKFVPWASVEERVKQVEELITICWKGGN